jgi:hypothetical protein
MSLRSLKYILLVAAPLLTAACGDEYELIKTDTMFPYGNQRTAGSGYAYVLKNMLPEKTVVLETTKTTTTVAPAATPPPPAPVAEPPSVTPPPSQMEKVFNDSQKK